MEAVVTNIVIFYNEIIKLLLFGNIFFKIEVCGRKKLITYMLLGGCCAGILAYLLEYSLVVQWDTVLMVIVAYLIVKNLKLIYIILGLCVVSLVDVIFCGFISVFFNIAGKEILSNSDSNILVNSLLTVLLFLFWIVNRQGNFKKNLINFNTKSVYTLIIGALSLALYIAFAQVIGFDSGNSYHQRIAILALCIGSGLCFSALCGGIYYYTQNAKLVHEMALKEKFLNQQKMYYTMLLDKEEKTKRFRHDIRGHINSIRTLIEEKDFECLNEYLDDLDVRLKNLQLKIYTGNNVVNAIVADIQNQYMGVHLEWNGRLADDIRIRTIDLCIIFSNLLNNAFFAVKNTTSKEVKVDIKILESNLYINIINEIDQEICIEKKKTVKKIHREGHGYGLQNVRDCVESYNGIFEIHAEKNHFIAEIILPNVIT